MIIVRNATNTLDIPLTRVDHVTSAEDAAQKLWESVFDAAKIHGGSARLYTPEERGTGGGWAVNWNYGPDQWADAYVVSEGADTIGFVAEAEGGDTVVFRDTD